MMFATNMMSMFGITASLMSLGAIDFGLIVDSSVIMVENCMHRLAHRPDGKSRAAGHSRRGHRSPQADDVWRIDHRDRLRADPDAAGNRGQAVSADGVDRPVRVVRIAGAFDDADAGSGLAGAAQKGVGQGSLVGTDHQNGVPAAGHSIDRSTRCSRH